MPIVVKIRREIAFELCPALALHIPARCIHKKIILTRGCAQSDLKVSPVRGNLFRRPTVCGRGAHVYDDVQVVAHDRPRVHAASKNLAEF